MTEKKKFLRRAIHDKENPYLMVKRTTAQDKQLSYEARGMLVYILSQRDDWKVQPTELIIEGCGRDKVYRILKELIKAKFIEHEKTFNEQHKIVWGDYIVHEYPYSEKPDTANQEMDLGEKPFPENPDTEKPHINEYRNTKVTKETTRKREPFYDAIASTFKLTASGQIVSIRSMMQGKATRGTWKDCNFSPPVTDAQEIIDFAAYMAKRMSEKRITEPITAAVTIQRWFYDFREAQIKASQPKTEKERWAEIPELRGITEIIR